MQHNIGLFALLNEPYFHATMLLGILNDNNTRNFDGIEFTVCAS